MSGHSKWSTIKRKKGAADAKRSNIFTKLIKEITIASRIGGGDPNGNPRLRLAIDKARTQSMPKENIEKAIKRGTGELEGTTIEEVTYEAFGPGGIALMIDCTTDNKNRTVADVRAILTKRGGNLGENGSVSYMFEMKGQIRISSESIAEEELFEKIIEASADDMQKEGDMFVVSTSFEGFHKVSDALKTAGVTITDSGLEQVPKNMLKIEDEETAQKVLTLVEYLEESDDVQNVWSNFDIDDEMLEKLSG